VARPDPAFAELREQALTANLEIVRAGLVVLTFGNASAADRATGAMAIKPSGAPYAELTASTIPVLDIASGAVLDGGQRPSSDAPTHLVLYRAFVGVGGIVHTHSPFATAWAQARRELPCLGTTHADHFLGAVPVARLLTPAEIESGYEEATGAVIAEALADRGLDPHEMPAALVPSHGPFAWGVDAAEAVENAVALEAVAAGSFRSLALQPELESIQPELLDKHFRRKHGPDAYYGQPL
jgi:L-ribulose-5-phosphate 4-epimerase